MKEKAKPLITLQKLHLYEISLPHFEQKTFNLKLKCRKRASNDALFSALSSNLIQRH